MEAEETVVPESLEKAAEAQETALTPVDEANIPVEPATVSYTNDSEVTLDEDLFRLIKAFETRVVDFIKELRRRYVSRTAQGPPPIPSPAFPHAFISPDISASIGGPTSSISPHSPALFCSPGDPALIASPGLSIYSPALLSSTELLTPSPAVEKIDEAMQTGKENKLGSPPRQITSFESKFHRPLEHFPEDSSRSLQEGERGRTPHHRQKEAEALQHQLKGIDEIMTKVSDVICKVCDELETEVVEVARPLLSNYSDYESTEQSKESADASNQKVESNAVDESENTDADPGIGTYLESLIELAKKLSYSTRAPVGWTLDKNLVLPVPFKPPFPQEEHMKKGLLYTDTSTLLEALHQKNIELAAMNEAASGGDKQGEVDSSETSTAQNQLDRMEVELGAESAPLSSLVRTQDAETAIQEEVKPSDARRSSEFNLSVISVEEGTLGALGHPPTPKLKKQISLVKAPKKRDTTFDMGISSDESEGSDENDESSDSDS